MKSKIPSPFPSSPYTPFLRRFTDERAADIAETRALYDRVTARFRASVWSQPDIAERVNGAIAEIVTQLTTIPPGPIAEGMDRCQLAILAQETTLFTTPVINNWSTITLKEQVDLSRHLRAQEHFLANEDRVYKLLSTALANVFAGLAAALPATIAAHSAFTVPLYVLLDCNDIIDRINGTLCTAEHADAGVLVPIADHIYRNICAASKVPPYEDHRRPLISAADSDLRGAALVEAYLAGTPFYDFFQTPIPFTIPLQRFQAHGIIIAPPEHGKTQLLQTLIHGFLKEPDPPGLVILDPHGDLFNTLKTRVDPARLILLDPDDDPPELNFLDFGNATQTQALQALDYLMSSLSGGLSEKQSGIAPYLLRLLQKIPDASIMTLKQLVDEKVKKAEQSAFYPLMQQLQQADQDFFRHQFYAGRMQETKDAMGWKIAAAIAYETFQKMFSAPRNTFSAEDAMRERKVVLVKGSESSLGEHGMPVFLQYIISQYFLAAMKRQHIPKSERQLCLMIADEAAHIFNTQTTRILTETRKWGLGFLGATQMTELIPKEVKAAIYGATAVKIAGAVAHSDASTMANEMYTTTEFIRSCRSIPGKHAEWAFYASGIPGLTAAIKLTAPFGVLEKDPEYPQPPRKPKPPPVPRLRTVGYKSTLTFSDYAVTLPCLLDSGADGSMLTTKYTISADKKTVSFFIRTTPVTMPIERWNWHVGINGRSYHPHVTLRIEIAGHTALEDMALTDLDDDEPLIGRTFLAGRFLVDPATISPPKDKPKKAEPKRTPSKVGEPPPTDAAPTDLDTDH